MEFKKENVYYALNATEDLIGAKGYFAQSIDDLRYFVVENCGKINEVISLNDGFMVQAYDNYNFFYLVEPAPAKPKYRPFKDCDELIETYKEEWCSDLGEYDLPTIWVKSKDSENQKFLITYFCNNYVSLNGSPAFELDRLFRLYTFLDGSPCGVEE